ncbi:MAG: ABC transporter ATP-binding protein [Pseudomonadota bacterium]
MQPIVQANNVCRHFHGHKVLHELSLTIERGEVLALLGTNGAGKTTTLRLLTGELTPNRGSVLVKNVDINLHPEKAKQHLGYLPDTPPLYTDLTVDEFLTYVARIRGTDKKQTKSRLKEVKTFCELNNVSTRLIKKLSKGYQQRIGIAQAIIHKPHAVILDEPTNGLDPTQMQEMRDLILHLRKDAGILLSTHQLGEVEQICDRVHLLKQGQTVLSKKISELQQVNTIALRFIKKAPINDIQSNDEIGNIKFIDDNTLRINPKGSPSHDHLDALKNSLLAQSEANNWGLVEIYDVHDTLENIFINEVLRDKA